MLLHLWLKFRCLKVCEVLSVVKCSIHVVSVIWFSKFLNVVFKCQELNALFAKFIYSFFPQEKLELTFIRKISVLFSGSETYVEVETHPSSMRPHLHFRKIEPRNLHALTNLTNQTATLPAWRSLMV